MRSGCERIAAWACAAAIAVCSASAGAKPKKAPKPAPEPAPVVVPPEETPLGRAEALFRRGVTRYETANYDEAVQLWTEAYEILEPTRENRGIRNDLVYNISRAQVEAYRIDDDPKRLRQAKQLLEQYVSVYRELSEGDDTSEGEIAQAEARIGEIDAMLDAAERKLREERARAARPANEAAKRQARTLVISGAAVTSVGIVGLAVAFAGLGVGVRADKAFEEEPAQRDLNRRRGRQANVLVATGTTVGVAFLAAGIALLVVGKRNEKKLRVGAMAGRGTMGLTLSARF